MALQPMIEHKTSAAKSGRLRRVAGPRASPPSKITSIRCVIARGALSDATAYSSFMQTALLWNSGPRQLQLERYHIAPWPGRLERGQKSKVRQRRHRFLRIHGYLV